MQHVVDVTGLSDQQRDRLLRAQTLTAMADELMEEAMALPHSDPFNDPGSEASFRHADQIALGMRKATLAAACAAAASAIMACEVLAE